MQANPKETPPAINSERLWATIHALAEIGATKNGGVTRLAFTDEDRAGRAFFVAACRAIGMEIERDAFGNLFAVSPDRDGETSAPSVVVGSHLDSQAAGGKYDGAYGVMCGLEIARALHESGMHLAAPFEIAVWANEEGARFAPPMMGSGVFSGVFDLDEMLNKRDEDGISICEEIVRDAALTDIPLRPDRPIKAYFEPHIEQGPILEAEGVHIGIVQSAQAVRWLDLEITGFQAHAGPTPMNLRKDALLAASECALAAEGIARGQAPHGRATCGVLRIRDASRNVIPGAVELSVDMRHPNDSVLESMIGELEKRCAEIGASRGVSIKSTPVWTMKAVKFDERLVSALRAAAEARQIRSIDMVSGAGHDALYIARRWPAAMIFTPCGDGVSHNEAENMTRDDAALACQVTLDAILPLLTNQ